MKLGTITPGWYLTAGGHAYPVVKNGIPDFPWKARDTTITWTAEGRHYPGEETGTPSDLVERIGDFKTVVMRAGRCLLADGREGVAFLWDKTVEDRHEYPWQINVDGKRVDSVRSDGLCHEGKTSPFDVVAMLNSFVPSGFPPDTVITKVYDREESKPLVIDGDRILALVTRALGDYRMVRTFDENQDGLDLLDALTPPNAKTVEDGKIERESLADEITSAITEGYAHTPAPKPVISYEQWFCDLKNYAGRVAESGIVDDNGEWKEFYDNGHSIQEAYQQGVTEE